MTGTNTTTSTRTIRTVSTVGSTGWCCVDCLMSLANGEPHPDEAKFDAGVGGAEVTLGMVGDEHSEDCEVFVFDSETGVRVWDGSFECECELRGFSWSPCDVCGSRLGGSRHAVTFFPVAHRTAVA